MKNRKRKRPDDTLEFRANAVKLAMQGGTSIAELARDLGVSEGSLYKEAANGLSEDERDETRPSSQRGLSASPGA